MDAWILVTISMADNTAPRYLSRLPCSFDCHSNSIGRSTCRTLVDLSDSLSCAAHYHSQHVFAIVSGSELRHSYLATLVERFLDFYL
jgi:hypothetical protein